MNTNSASDFQVTHELARTLANDQGRPHYVVQSKRRLSVVAWDEFVPTRPEEIHITWIAWPENWPLRTGE